MQDSVPTPTTSFGPTPKPHALPVPSDNIPSLFHFLVNSPLDHPFIVQLRYWRYVPRTRPGPKPYNAPTGVTRRSKILLPRTIIYHPTRCIFFPSLIVAFHIGWRRILVLLKAAPPEPRAVRQIFCRIAIG